MIPAIRPGRDDDAEGVIRLIGDCWAEYPGCVLDVDGELPELRSLASWFAQAGGDLWVADHEVGLAGMVGVRPRPDGSAWEICRLYVDGAARGGGLADALLERAEARARAAGAEALVLWTDTRFLRAHAFYEKRGYLRQGPIRVLDDVSHSLEFRYAKPARGIAVAELDAAAAASAARCLGRLMVDAAAHGMSEAYLPPAQPARARDIWRGVAARVAQGRCALLVAWEEGEIAGTVQLDLDVAPTQSHRALMIHLLLDPSRDRSAIAAALLLRVEAAAAAHGRSLITCELPDTGVADHCRFAGWREVGRIPGGLVGADSAVNDSLIFWKSVASGMLPSGGA
ncbi:GNAT family N-acetyltransferase [Plastoroseomonas arctica]|uniref:GNAT family N-acetyltransferase n=1 Tax=Plastoroseomonas arctica TaxID=1509237 RepID=UPI0034617F7B